MNEECKQQHQIKHSVVVLLLNSYDPRWPEGIVVDGAVVPWEETKLEQVLYHNYSLE